MSGVVTVLDEDAIRRIVREAVRDELAPIQQALAALTKPPDPGALLTGEEVDALLRIDERSRQRLIHEGIIPPGIGLGSRRLRWRRSAIMAAVEKLEQESAAPALRRSRPGASVSGVKTTTGGRS